MIIDDEKLLLGFFMNKEKNASGEYITGIGAKINRENFNQACDQLFTHITQQVGKNDKWTFLFSVMYSVVDSITHDRPDIIKDMILQPKRQK